MPQLIDMFAPTRQTLASMGQAFATDRQRGLDEEDRGLATERHGMMMDKGLADLKLGETQQQSAELTLENLQREQTKQKEFDAHMANLPTGADPLKESFDYWKTKDPKKAMETQIQIQKTAVAMSALDPKGATDYLNKMLGSNLEYTGAKDGYETVTDKAAGKVMYIDVAGKKIAHTVDITPEVKKQTKAEIDAGFEKKLAKEYAAMDPELTDVEAMVKAKETLEAIKLKGKHTPKSAVVQNFGDMEKKEIATAAAKDKAFWTGTKAREKAGEIAKAEAGDDWEDLETSAKKLKTKLILNRKITSVYPDAKFGEDKGIMGWYAPDETGKMKIIQRWND